MKILAIETSCDETAAAITSKELKNDHVKILSNVVASSLVLHSKTGGIVPEIAAREQLKFIIPVIKRAIKDSKVSIKDIDAIAVTVGPGLIGSLLIGIETAKTLAYLWKKPIIPVNHLLGHIYANFIITTNKQQLTNNNKKLEVSSQRLEVVFPALALLVSGGHTDLILIKSHKDIEWLGGTLDDAAGEAFDKIGRLLNFTYPAGPAIEKASERGDASRFTFPRPMIGSHDFNFSFSGLKAAVFRKVSNIKYDALSTQVADIAASAQQAIVDVLVRKTLKAVKKYNAKSILLGGGVAANQKLREYLELEIGNCPPASDFVQPSRYKTRECRRRSRAGKLEIKLFFPEKSLCTDNAAMIGAYAAFNYKPIRWNKITANPELYF